MNFKFYYGCLNDKCLTVNSFIYPYNVRKKDTCIWGTKILQNSLVNYTLIFQSSSYFCATYIIE